MPSNGNFGLGIDLINNRLGWLQPATKGFFMLDFKYMAMDDSSNSAAPFTLMTQDEDIERASRSMKAMSHPLRLKILCTLGSEELSVQDIVEYVGTSQSNISQHLAILRDKGILASRKDANRVYYRVGDARTLRLISMMREVFCSFCT